MDLLIGDPTKANTKLGWKATCTLAEMVSEMVRSDIAVVSREAGLRRPDEERGRSAAE